MPHATDMLQHRRDRALRLSAYQAGLHANAAEHAQLVAVMDAWRDGSVSTTDASSAVEALRSRQRDTRTAAA